MLAPYVAANLVTLIDFPGKAMQMPAYDDALEKFRFTCRYMAFIDIDEFIFPKTNQSIAQVADEILSRDENAQALAINWRCFGSNGLTAADYSRGVLERFTQRAPDKWKDSLTFADASFEVGNMHVKLVANPRSVKTFLGPHIAVHFGGNYSVDEHGEKISAYGTDEMTADKIAVNHYVIKSREEFFNKRRRGFACDNFNPYDNENYFSTYDRNEIFDDGILSYRAARDENFSLETDADRIRRVEKTLLDTLTQCSPLEAPSEFFAGKLETFLTCRALAEGLDVKIGTCSAEELALTWIYQCFEKKVTFTYAELFLFMSALPEILARPFPICKELNRIAREKIFHLIYANLKSAQAWDIFYDFRYIERLLLLVK